MKRQQFLFGLFSGLLLGVGTTIASFALVSDSALQSPVPQPVTNSILLETQSAPSGIPPGAHSFEFNGRVYYIVPLA
jgi:hypothetical protein